ncbi:hypothetical protein NA647_18985 [Pseudomonas stutzeri]|uniref:POTRA domain-containing protein n=1 Tax=Stutzerimonas stutzeri TaxID=316 RepID=UPI00210C54D4|nr:POTRA domain-containing protein [Stutzerimonas stutzeri]MCQ4289499.1 hypothetical protein [Stutzerimonas stutzeri]
MLPLLFVAFVSVFLFFAGSASAQVPPSGTPLPGERDLIRDRQERLLDLQRQRLEDLQQLPGRDAVEPEQVQDDQRCFDIHTISLKGATLVSAQQQATLVQPYQGKCLGANQLNALLKAITQFYIDRGYVLSS